MLQQLAEAVEEVARVVGAGRGLGVELHAHDGKLQGAQALEGAVVEVHVGGLHVRHALDVHAEAVVLGADLDVAVELVQHRVVAAVVPELELAGGAAEGPADELVAQADADHGHVLHELPDGGGLFRQRGGVAGAVGKEDRLGAAVQHFLDGELRGHHDGREALALEQADDVPLDAEVVDHDGRAAVREGKLAAGGRDDVPAAVALEHPGALGADEGHEVLPLHGGQGLGLPDKAFPVEVFGRDHAAHGAVAAHLDGESAGVEAFHAGNAVPLHELGQAHDGAPVGGLLAALLDQEGAHVDALGLVVALGDAVVAYLGVGEADELAAVGGIGEELLVAAHPRVEDDLAAGFEFAREGGSFQGEAVFKSKQCLH